MLKQLLRIAVSIGVSFAIIALLLQMVNSGLPDQQRPSVLSALQNTSLSFVVGCFVVYLITLFIRAYRYRLLIAVSGEENVPTMRQMALVTGIRNMIVDLLPARLGELGYVGLLNRGYGVKLEHCISSLTITVAFDLVALLVIVIMVVAKQLVGASVEPWAIAALLSAIVLAMIAVVGLFVFTPWFSRWLARTFPASQAASWWAKLVQLADDFSTSLNTVRQAGKTTQIVSLSVVIRILKYFSIYLLFLGVTQPSFPALAEIPVEQTVMALMGGELGSGLPIPTFMSFGAYEAGSALVFSLLGVADQAQAVVTMLCVHIWSQMMEYILGGILLASFILMRRRARQQEAQQAAAGLPRSRTKSVLAFGASGLVLLLGTFFLAYQVWAASKLGALSAPEAGAIAEDDKEWQALSKAHVSRLNGFVVFSSNRDGNHDIFKLTLRDFELSKLTTHPHTETYPRISPNGRRVIFSRAHQEWVSQRNTVAWDVYMLDLETKQEIKVGENGTAPQWLNNQEITYLQDATKVIKVRVEEVAQGVAGQEIIYQTGVNNPMPAGAKIQNPKYNPKTKQLAFTGRQSEIGMNSGHWGTALTNADDHTGFFNGCELGWNSAGTALYQVAGGGWNDTLRIIDVAPDGTNKGTLIDLEGEFSHEYWPKDSSNGEYMVFGASRGPKDHEHDTKDYEIFLWKVGSDSSKATRLTFHTGNDNWPDVFIAD